MNPGAEKRLREIYNNAKQRCNNPTATGFKNYGGRGIFMCNEWFDSPSTFFEWALNNGYRDDLTIERKDTNGPYSPDNCIWVSMNHQLANRRPRPSRSPYVGVDQIPGGNWRAKIKYRGIVTYLGVHSTAEEAADARDEYIKANQLPHTRSR